MHHISLHCTCRSSKMSPKSEKRPQKDPFWTLFAHSSPTWPPSIKPPTQVFFSRALPPYISLLEPKSPTKTPKKAILSQNAQKRPPKRTYPPISRQPGHLQPPNKAQSHFQSRIHHISFYILHSHPKSHPKTRQNPKNAPNAPQSTLIPPYLHNLTTYNHQTRTVLLAQPTSTTYLSIKSQLAQEDPQNRQNAPQNRLSRQPGLPQPSNHRHPSSTPPLPLYPSLHPHHYQHIPFISAKYLFSVLFRFYLGSGSAPTRLSLGPTSSFRAFWPHTPLLSFPGLSTPHRENFSLRARL